MRPLFQADADLNQEVVPGPRRREPAVDFQDALAGGVIGTPDKPVPAGLAADLPGGALFAEPAPQVANRLPHRLDPEISSRRATNLIDNRYKETQRCNARE